MLRFAYTSADRLTEGLLYFGIVFGPWAFGTTQAWSVGVMNYVGFALGFLWILKVLIRQRLALKSEPTDTRREDLSHKTTTSSRYGQALMVATLLVLLYCAASVWNARATYDPVGWQLDYRAALKWLPHSYDREASLEFLLRLIGLAGLFWAVRDWVLHGPGDGREGFSNHPRLRRLFLVLAFNGLALAIEGIIQRADGGGKLLWLVEPRINKSADSQFGPYAYRANAAQYFNLLWPAVLGFWLDGALRSSSTRRNRDRFLIPCVALMAVCPFISLSRAAAGVVMIELVLAGLIVWLAFRRMSRKVATIILVTVTAVLAGGILLGWTALKPRLDSIESGYIGRQTMYAVGREIAADNQPYGIGPGAFSHLYQFYRRSFNEYWPAQMHNDWLETLITFGWAGFTILLIPFFLTVTRWVKGKGVRIKLFALALFWVALGGCMLHACVDFPFQVHSILALFTILCAVLSCVGVNRSFSARRGGISLP